MEKEDAAFKVSNIKKNRMRQMCGIPKNSGDECFLKLFWDLFEKYLDELGREQIFLEAIERIWMSEDSDVQLYPALVKNS